MTKTVILKPETGTHKPLVASSNLAAATDLINTRHQSIYFGIES
jgi:hypothetical protein